MRILPSLVALALVDSTSFGTFDIPLVMMIQKRIRASAVAAYLLAIAAFYWVAGMAIVSFAHGLVQFGSSLMEHRAFAWAELVLGVALLVGSLFMSQKRADEKKAARAASDAPPTRIERWQARLLGDRASLGAVAGIAVGVGLLEVATMIPFLGAMTMILNERLALAQAGLIVAGYVTLMVLPPFVMLAARLALGAKIEPTLERIHAWIESHATVVLAWVLRIVAALTLWDAWGRLSGAST